MTGKQDVTPDKNEPKIKVKERKRGQDSSNILNMLGLDISSIGVEIRLKDEDKEMLKNALQEISRTDQELDQLSEREPRLPKPCVG